MVELHLIKLIKDYEKGNENKKGGRERVRESEKEAYFFLFLLLLSSFIYIRQSMYRVKKSNLLTVLR